MSAHDAKKMRRLTCFALVLVTVAVYWRVVGFEFVNFDDPEYVTENEMVRQGLTLRGIVWAFTEAYASNWHPLTWISHMADCQLFALHAGGHHFVSVLFHAANAVLLFLLLFRLTGAQWRSAVVAGLFAWHPLHVESVAWISERKDVLSTFFGLLSLLAYTAWARQKWKPGRPLALLCFVLGLLAKPMLVTLPCVLLLLDFWPLQRVENTGWRTFFTKDFRRLVFEKWPWFVLTIASCIITFYAQKSGGAVVSVTLYPLSWRVTNALVSYYRYAGKVFWPGDLTIYYPLEHYRFILQFIAATLVMLLVSTATACTAKRWPCLLFGWLWFLGTLVPVIGLVQVGNQAIADRYTYIPAIGLFIGLVWWVHELLAASKRGRTLGAAAAGAGLLICAGWSFSQVRYWKNSVVLFSHAVDVTYDNSLAYNNIGAALLTLGQKEAALKALREAVRIDPNSALIQGNVANTLAEAGSYDEAFKHFAIAELLDPANARVQNLHGIALVKAGQPEKALPCFHAALRLKSNYAEGFSNLGAALTSLGRIEEGITNLQRAIAIAPNSADAYNNLGRALAKQKKNAEAISQYQKALTLNPANASVHYNLGLALDKLGRAEEAFAHFGKAVAVDTNSVEARYQYGRGLFVRGQVINAIAQLAAAVRLKPDHGQAQLYLGLAYFEYGRTEASLEHLRIAGRLLPESVEALNAQAWVLATTENNDFRNGAEAVRLAEQAAALSERKSAAVLHTLAAAYAAVERFDDAIATATRAQELARAQSQTSLVDRLNEALTLYQSKRPLRHEVQNP